MLYRFTQKVIREDERQRVLDILAGEARPVEQAVQQRRLAFGRLRLWEKKPPKFEHGIPFSETVRVVNFDLALFTENDTGRFAEKHAVVILVRVVVDCVTLDAAKFLHARFLVSQRTDK